MKKNKIMRFASFLLVAVMLSTCAISGTFAKYSTQATGSDSARIAKWAFTGVDVKNGTVAVTLFDNILDTVDGKTDEEVATNLIAPGTKGSFTMTITNNSEVDATCAISFTETVTDNKDVPIVYCLTENGTYGDISTLNVAAERLDMTQSKTITVYWQWAFEGNDTQLGIDAADKDISVTVAATVDLVQVD